jgi:Ribosomal protein S1
VIDGMVHLSDFSWDAGGCGSILSYFLEGDRIEVQILDIYAG